MDIVEKEYQKDGKLKKEDVKLFLDWMAGQQHLPKITEHEGIWFLKSCYYSNEAAKITIDNYFTMKSLSPEILRNRDISRDGLKDAMERVLFTVLPKRAPDGYTLVMSHFQDTNPEFFNCNENMKLFDMVTLLDMHKNGAYEGLRCCFDMEGMTFSHLTKIGIIPLKKFLYYVQEGMPIRLKGLHFFNSTSVMDKLLMMMKPFLKKEVIELVHLHSTVQDMEKFVPLECLPIDYGGKCDSNAVLHDQMKRNLKENIDFFAYQDSQLVDESKRPGKPKNSTDIFGVDGTFKKLELD